MWRNGMSPPSPRTLGSAWRRTFICPKACISSGLLALVFGSTRHVALVLANIPFALVGGVLAVFATGSVLSIGSLVGFVTLFGISMRNSIMLLLHYEHLVFCLLY